MSGSTQPYKVPPYWARHVSQDVVRVQRKVYKMRERGTTLLAASIMAAVTEMEPELKKPWWKRMIGRTRCVMDTPTGP